MKKTLVALLAVLIALVVAVPASADQPELWYDEDYDNIWPLFDCRLIGYDYTILVREIGHHSEELYYDKDHVLVKTFYKAKGNGYLFNEHNPALMVDNNYDIKSHVEMTSTSAPFTWIRRSTGLFFNLQLPGEGTVIHVSGQFVEDVEEWVVMDVLKTVGNETIDFPTVCAALAG
jgi:hypothetical protein